MHVQPQCWRGGSLEVTGQPTWPSWLIPGKRRWMAPKEQHQSCPLAPPHTGTQAHRGGGPAVFAKHTGGLEFGSQHLLKTRV